MLPVLQVGPLAIQAYPLALVLAGWLALAVGARAAQRLGIDSDHVYNAGLGALAAGLVAGRLAHVVAFWPAYRSQPLEIIGLNTTTFLVWPGVLAALAAWGWYIYRHRLPLPLMLDALAPGLLVGLAVAEMGAFLAGRGPGAPADLPWSVVLWGARRHPVQLYAAAGYLGVAVLVWRMLGGRAGAAGSLSGEPAAGVTATAFSALAPALVALLGWGLVQWLVEAFRAPEASAAFFAGMRLGQVQGLAAALAALVGLRYLSTRDKDEAPLVR